MTTDDLEEMGRYFCVALSRLQDSEQIAEGEVREKDVSVGKDGALGWKDADGSLSSSGETSGWVTIVNTVDTVCA